MSGDGQRLFGGGAPGHGWRDIAGVECNLAVETGVCVSRKLGPVPQGRLPIRAFRGKVAPFDVIECHLIRGHQPQPRSPFDAEIAQRQAPLHAQCADSGAGIFNRVAACPIGPQLCDPVQSQIFGCDTGPQFAVHSDPHRFGPLLPDCLRRQNMRHLCRTDAKGQRTKGPMR